MGVILELNDSAGDIEEALHRDGVHEIPGFGTFSLEDNPFAPGTRTVHLRTDRALSKGNIEPPANLADLVRRLRAREKVVADGLGTFEGRVHRGIGFIIVFRADRAFHRRMQPRPPGPFDVPGALRLDRLRGRPMGLPKPAPVATAQADLTEAMADPRFADVHTVEIRGAVDGDARALQGSGRVLLLTDGTLTNASVPLLGERGSVDGNTLTEAGLRLLPIGITPGFQDLPHDEPTLDYVQFHLPNADHDALFERWSGRLVDVIAEALDRVGVPAKATTLRTVKPRTVKDDRWVSIVGHQQRQTRLPGWRSALKKTTCGRSRHPAVPPVRELIARSAALIDTAIDHAGDKGMWCVDFALLVAQAEGMLQLWRDDAPPPLYPPLDIYRALFAEVAALNPR